MENKFGFTMIELLLVVGMITVLTGLVTTVINVPKQRENAEYAVRRETLAKLVSGMEGFFNAEGYYPASNTAPGVSSYIAIWPASGYTYFYDSVLEDFSITSYASGSFTDPVLKYSSVWKEIRDCGGGTAPTVVDECLPL